ncbi:MAG: hypothetical protein CMM44_01000 [Rhodospirillaceae bacterium]|nr:hypothetical protein [Rhodospirillaceae bacterium]|tara:strand:+ start:730 stop:1782 length:1053 start_codon:yes stop_codon:yes gene_type:complete
MNQWEASNKQRRYASLGNPIVDPAEWLPSEILGKKFWIWNFSEREIREIELAASMVNSKNCNLLEISKDNFYLPTLSNGLSKIREEIIEGRGFALLRGLSADNMSVLEFATAFWGIGRHIGDPICQNTQGHMLGHVKDLDKDYSKVRGYMTNAHMAFHCDQSDIIALGCIHNAMKGGHHMICSSVALYNRMLEVDPDAVKLLGQNFFRSRQGEIPPGETLNWITQPVFGFKDGYFAARGVSAAIEKAQGLKGVPMLTKDQRSALQLFKEMAPQLATEIPFEHGDILLLCNHVILHSRTEFEDWPQRDRKRHLLRLWLTTNGARPVPNEISRWSNGIYTENTRFCVPLDAV